MDQKSIFQKKTARIVDGAPPRVLDLFAGCGGISLGFQRAGFNIIAAVEIDPEASKSHARNFHNGTEKEFALHSEPIDINSIGPHELMSRFKLGRVDDAVDVIVGGPPCQAFARIGRAKLREIASHPQAYKNDSRASLYIRYIEYVSVLKPLAILIENVPDILNFGGHNISEEICETLEELGYECTYTLLNSAFYGVPQTRERMFLVGMKKGVGSTFNFPKPTHWTELPRGYLGTRRTALKVIGSHFIEPPHVSSTLPLATTAQEATADLPRITAHLEGKLKRGARRFDEVIPYPFVRKLNAYSRMMREWPGFEAQTGIADHVIRSLPRDYKIFKVMKAGDEYPAAYEAAKKLFEQELLKRNRKGERLNPGSKAYNDLEREFVPPYDPSKFPNKWRKMEPDAPARTLLAHLGKDGYSHIHYDSEQARTISVREAARLQSFPDGFIFAGTMNPAFRQIGNAVPPLMAFALARAIHHSLLSVVAEVGLRRDRKTSESPSREILV